MVICGVALYLGVGSVGGGSVLFLFGVGWFWVVLGVWVLFIWVAWFSCI
jgi:hypothetical protein